MKVKAVKTIAIMFVTLNLILIAFLGISLGAEEEAKMPAWRPGNVWQYNMTMPSEPNYRQTATIKVTGWGRYYADDGTEYPTFSSFYVTNVNHTDETYGYIYIRVQQTRSIIRTNYSTAHFDDMTLIIKGDEKYFEYSNITKCKPMIDQYMFPIELGEVWEQYTMLNTTSVLYEWVEVGDNWVKNKVSETLFFTNVTTYYNCTGIEDVEVTIVSDWDDYIDTKTVNWTKETFSAFAIQQDNESQDSDGCYIVEYWSEEVGNIVKKDVFKNYKLFSTRSLVYKEYVYTDIPFEEPDIGEEGNPYANLFLWGGLGMVVVLLGVGVIRIRRRMVVEGEELTKEDIMRLETRGEYIELCEKFGLSTKGSKGQLRKRLLRYLEETEET